MISPIPFWLALLVAAAVFSVMFSLGVMLGREQIAAALQRRGVLAMALFAALVPVPAAALLVGMCNAVGGGLIRDILVREEPMLLKPGQLFAIAAFVGCPCFVLLSYKYGVDTEHAAWIAIFITLLIRVLAVRFNWTTRAFGWWRARRDDDADKRR
jgi:uncharacterized membrane protein YeiH